MRICLGAHEQGLIITTRDFGLDTIKEGDPPGKTPIGLMNGEQFVALLMANRIGVRRSTPIYSRSMASSLPGQKINSLHPS